MLTGNQHRLYQDQLVVYYANTGSIMHKTSQDMINWSPSVLDAPNTGDTGWPAKPNVLELPDGRFMLAYEQGQAPDVMIQVTPAFYRITSNPLDFGNIPPESIQTKDGDMLVWAPRLAWSSIGGPSGVIIATGTWTHKLYFNRALGDPTAWENTTELLQPWADTTQWGPDIRNAMELRVFQEDPNALLLMTAGPTGPHPDINEYFNVSVSVSDLSVLLNIH